MIKTGEVSWTELDFTNKKAEREAKQKEREARKAANKEKYVKLKKDQENRFRMATNAHEYLVHSKWKPTGDNIDASKVQTWGYSIKCSGVGGQTCPLCVSGHKPNRQWYIGVIERDKVNGDKAKILDAKRSIVEGIKTLTKMEDWGHPSMYDISIFPDSSADPKNYYKVTGCIPKPMTGDDIELKNSIDTEELVRMTAVPTPEDVQSSIDRIVSFASIKPAPGAATTAATTRSTTPGAKTASDVVFPPTDASDEDSFTFQDADAS